MVARIGISLRKSFRALHTLRRIPSDRPRSGGLAVGGLHSTLIRSHHVDFARATSRLGIFLNRVLGHADFLHLKALACSHEHKGLLLNRGAWSWSMVGRFASSPQTLQPPIRIATVGIVVPFIASMQQAPLTVRGRSQLCQENIAYHEGCSDDAHVSARRRGGCSDEGGAAGWRCPYASRHARCDVGRDPPYGGWSPYGLSDMLGVTADSWRSRRHPQLSICPSSSPPPALGVPQRRAQPRDRGTVRAQSCGGRVVSACRVGVPRMRGSRPCVQPGPTAR